MCVLVVFGVIVAVLLAIGRKDYLHLHTILDTGMALLSGVLALLLWDMGTRMNRPFPKWLSIAFAAMFVLVIPTVMVGLSTSLSALIFWRAIQGLVLPPIFAVMVAYIGDELPHHEATTVTGIYSSGSSLGGFTGAERPAQWALLRGIALSWVLLGRGDESG